MDGWYATLAARRALSADAANELTERGFVILPGPIPMEEMPRLRAAYDTAVARAAAEDVGFGRASTRVNDFVNRGAAFDSVYTWPPALDACCRVIGRSFRLSAMHARTLRPGASAQELHADVPRTSDAWPMVGLILMVDDFRADNGATRFVPGSQWWTAPLAEVIADCYAPHPREVVACGVAGSVILFNASTWHGHTANTSGAPRRSLQATFIPREGRPATDFQARMRSETLTRIDEVARYLTGVEVTVSAPPA